MVVSTGPIKFTITPSNNGWNDIDNLEKGESGDAFVNSGDGNNRRFQLRSPDSDILNTIPSDATIVGIEITTKTRVDAGSETLQIRPQILSGSNQNGPQTNHSISSTTNQTIVTGGPNDLLGLDDYITEPSILSGFRIRYRCHGTPSNTLFLAGDTGAPTVTFYYNEAPTPPSPSHIPGPSFMSLNVDLTKFGGLGDKVSNLDSFNFGSTDVFGFQNVIEPEPDPNSQVFSSEFSANPLTDPPQQPDSTKGQVNIKKAPLSVRRGFQGI